MIPRFRPIIGAAEFRALFSAKSERVAAFEHAFADKTGVSGAIAFPYGRSALWAFLKAVGVTGSEVVMPPYTCSVVAHAVALSGNQPRFVDIQLTDYNMDLGRLEEAISEKTRAVIPTHIFGYPVDMDRLTSIVANAEKKYGQKIWVIEDCAHSFGAARNGRERAERTAGTAWPARAGGPAGSTCARPRRTARPRRMRPARRP